MLPSYITNIRQRAFYGCDNLTSVVIGDNVITIGDYAFYNCYNLASVTIPDSVTSIGNQAFAACWDLADITVSANNTAYQSIDGNLYSKDGRTLIQYAIGKTNPTFVVPDGVRYISDEAVYNCNNLNSVVIGKDVTFIGDQAFASCQHLSFVLIPANVSNIGAYAFEHGSATIYCEAASQHSYWDNNWNYSNCPVMWGVAYTIEDGVLYGRTASLDTTNVVALKYVGNGLTARIKQQVEIGGGSYYVTTIREDIFKKNTYEDCDVSIVYVEASEYDFEDVWKWAPSGCTIVWDAHYNDVDKNGYIHTAVDNVHYAIRDGVATVWGYRKGTRGSLTIPATISYNGSVYNVTAIGGSAFYDCDNLTGVVIPDSVTSINNYAFAYCDNLASVVIPNSVTTIGDEAFYHCGNLMSVTIPDSVTSIGGRAFASCSNLAEFVVSENNTAYQSIDGNLYSKDGKTLVQYISQKPNAAFVVPNSVTVIGNYAFYECDNLTGVVIGDSVTSIGNHAFAYCDNLTSVIIGNGVTSIGYEAFYDCDNLVFHEYKHGKYLGNDNNPYLVLVALKSKNYSSYTIHSQTKVIVSSTFSDCDNLMSIVIPDSVTSIEEHAFAYCDNLTSVVIGDGVASIDVNAFYYCRSLTNVVIGSSVTLIGDHAFYYCSSLEQVYYHGTAEDWTKISIEDGNTWITSETRYYYSETQPTTAGNYWHYVDGVPTAW